MLIPVSVGGNTIRQGVRNPSQTLPPISQKSGKRPTSKQNVHFAFRGAGGNILQLCRRIKNHFREQISFKERVANLRKWLIRIIGAVIRHAVVSHT